MFLPILTCLAISLGQTGRVPAEPVPNFPSEGVQAELGLPQDTPAKQEKKAANDPQQSKDGNDVLPEPKADDGNGKDKNGNGNEKKEDVYTPGFLNRLFKAYKDEFTKQEDRFKKKDPPEEDPTVRRAAPQPWTSPPFPVHDYQGYPLIGIQKDDTAYPLQQALNGIPVVGDCLKNSGIKIYGWVTVEGNVSTSHNSNIPSSYWIVPDRLEMDQSVLRIEREMDTVQTDHIDWGFRSTHMYGIDYRYTTAGGWFSDQALVHNRLYGYDPIEQYFDLYVPWVMEGMVIRVGRWVACPDIETQLAPDNYLGSHSILFTYDTYTQTGVLLTFRPAERWLFQVGLNAGNDMAPWYQGAVPCGFLGLRWVSEDNHDAFYTVLNQIDNAEFRHFEVNGQPAGHDNFNYIVSTWEHKFNQDFHTKTEAYFMWQRDAEVGGTPSIGAPQTFGGGGGDGRLLPGTSLAYGVLNYSMYAISNRDYITVRNEWYRDERGMRTGFAGDYSSHTVGISHQFNDYLMLRPEVGYYRNWTQPAFDLGTRNGMLMAGFDLTFRF